MLGSSPLASDGLLEAPAPASRFNRNYLIAGSVVLFHVAALWALQSGLIRHAVEVVVPVQMISELLRPEPQVAPPPPPEPPVPPRQRPVVQKSEPVKAPAPQPVAIADPTPAPNAPTGLVGPQPPAPPIAAPVAVQPAPAPVPAPPRMVLPSTDADYLRNPKPVYPPLSKRLGEQGKVLIRALITAEGTVQSASVSQSSGYPRLDESALAAVLKWRFVPGMRNGVPDAMWHQIPVNYVLE